MTTVDRRLAEYAPVHMSAEVSETNVPDSAEEAQFDVRENALIWTHAVNHIRGGAKSWHR